jgi:hypothetical protein
MYVHTWIIIFFPLDTSTKSFLHRCQNLNHSSLLFWTKLTFFLIHTYVFLSHFSSSYIHMCFFLIFLPHHMYFCRTKININTTQITVCARGQFLKESTQVPTSCLGANVSYIGANFPVGATLATRLLKKLHSTYYLTWIMVYQGALHNQVDITTQNNRSEGVL